MDTSTLDGHILENCHARWQKVAMIIAKTAQNVDLTGVHDSYAAIAERIAALVDGGRLEAAGNLQDWRASEIRVPTPEPG